jgi:uncharacterized protein YacL
MMSPSLARQQAVAFLTGATFGAVIGLMLGSLAGATLAQAAVTAWRWVREEILHQEDEVDFELLLQ